MAIRLPDNSIQLSSGKIIYADTPILGQDLAEVMALLAPPQHFVAFTGRGAGGGSGGGPGGGGGSGGGGAGQRGPAGAAGADGAQGNQGSGGNQGNQGNQGPAAGGGGVEIASGTYPGNSESGAESQNIVTGLTNNIKFLVVFSIGPTSIVTSPVMYIMADSTGAASAKSRSTGAGGFIETTDIALVGPDFTVQGGANLDSGSYQWFAIG